MDRRFFLTSLLGAAGTSIALVALAPKAQAATLLEELAEMEASGGNLLAAELADMPASGATQAQYYYTRPHRAYRRRYYAPPPRIRRCRTFYDRWGRLVRRCWWR
jgi:hypothetical protein